MISTTYLISLIRILTQNEIKVLNRGLSFIPNQKNIEIGILLRGFEQLVCKMRLRFHFHGKLRKKFRFARKSHYQPDPTGNVILESVVDQMREQLQSLDYSQREGYDLTCGK